MFYGKAELHKQILKSMHGAFTYTLYLHNTCAHIETYNCLSSTASGKYHEKDTEIVYIHNYVSLSIFFNYKGMEKQLKFLVAIATIHKLLTQISIFTVL